MTNARIAMATGVISAHTQCTDVNALDQCRYPYPVERENDLWLRGTWTLGARLALDTRCANPSHALKFLFCCQSDSPLHHEYKLVPAGEVSRRGWGLDRRNNLG